MIVILYKFAKRIDSLKRPVNGVSKYAHLKESTEVTTPSIILKQSDIVSGSDDKKTLEPYNYIHIPSFNRYYYINSVNILDNDRVQLNCKEDVLATFADSIRTMVNTYTRTPSGTPEIIDSEYPLAKTEKVNYSAVQLFSETSDINIYIDIAGKADPSCNPTCTTYNMPIGTLKTLLNKVFLPDTYSTAGSVIDMMSATICNPSQYIIGCRIGRLGVKGNAVSSIKFGWKDIDVDGAYTIPQGMYVLNLERTITFPSVAHDITKTYALYIPTVGMCEINRTDIGNGTLSIKYSVDMSNGTAFCIVRNNKGKIVFTGTGQALVPLPISGVVAKLPNLSTGSLISSALTGATAMASTPGFGQAFLNQLSQGAQYAFNPPNAQQTQQLTANAVKNVPALTNGATNALNAMVEKSVIMTGGSGTISELFSEKNITAFTLTHDRISNNEFGIASYYRGTMTEHGYYRASYCEGNVSGAYDNEKEAIVSHLLQGVVNES